jgi:hypothetical protein
MPLIKTYNFDSDIYGLKGHSIFKSVCNAEALRRGTFGYLKQLHPRIASLYKTFGDEAWSQHNEWWGGWGIYSPNHQTSRLVEADCRMVHRTVRCTPDMSGAPATSPKPLEFDRWSSDFWARLDVRCTPDMYCSMSGAPVWACLTSARFWRALNAPAGDRWREVVVAPQLHRTVRCTPDMSGEL